MIEVTPVLHHSNGGIHINASAEVVTTRSDGTSSIILGLYAAGECTGGKSYLIHSKFGRCQWHRETYWEWIA